MNSGRPTVMAASNSLRQVRGRVEGYFRSSKILNLLSICCFLAGALYAISMLVYPWFVSPRGWKHVQLVWDRWQGLNVGMLAFLSSVIAFNISRYNAEQQRGREFLAAKAFLPQAFSELSEYFRSSASILASAWARQENENIDIARPQLPSDYREIFQKCIRHATPEVGQYLVGILVQMQVHGARMREFFRRDDGIIRINSDRSNLISYLYRLGQLQALINKNFDFARNIDPFDSKPLDWEDFRNAFGNLNIWYDHYVVDDRTNLEGFTKRAIERNNPN